MDDIALPMSAPYFEQQMYLDLTSYNIPLRRNICLVLALLRHWLQI